MAKTVAQLTAEMAKLTKAHDVMVKEAEEKKAEDAAKIEALTKENEAIKAETKKQRKEKAEEAKKSIRARLDGEPHHWVQVFYQGLDDGVDFGFTYEGIPFKLYSGKPVSLPESVIKHLKGCAYPITKLKQGEAGQGKVKVHGRHHNFNVVNCEAPAKAAG